MKLVRVDSDLIVDIDSIESLELIRGETLIRLKTGRTVVSSNKINEVETRINNYMERFNASSSS